MNEGVHGSKWGGDESVGFDEWVEGCITESRVRS